MSTTWTATMTEVCSGVQEDGFAAIFNNSYNPISLYRVFTPPSGARPAQDTNTSPGSISLVNINRITAVSSPNKTFSSYVKLDTNAADLPSQIEVGFGSWSFTKSGSSLRKIALFPSMMPLFNYSGNTQFGASNATRLAGATPQARAPKSTTVLNFAQSATSVPLTIRAGEGFGFFGTGQARSRAVTISLTLRNSSSGNCYIYHIPNCPLTFFENYCSFYVMNGSGSGVTLQVLSIEIEECGVIQLDNITTFMSTPYLSARLAWIDGYVGGTQVTPTAHDTTSSLPSGIEVVRGPFRCRLLGEDSTGAFNRFTKNVANSVPALTTAQQVQIGVLAVRSYPDSVMGANLGSGIPMYKNVFLDTKIPIVIPPRKGVAIINYKSYPAFSSNSLIQDVSPMSCSVMDIELTFNVEPKAGLISNGVKRLQ